MRCPYCNSQIPDGSVFCDKCGQSVQSENQTGLDSDKYWEKENFEKQKEVSRAREMQAAQEERKKRQKKTALASLIGIAVLAAIIVYSVVFVPQIRYNNALELLENGKYEEASGVFAELGNYRDSEEKIKECNAGITESNYVSAMEAYNSGNYEEALELFSAMENYQDSGSYIARCKENVYSSTYNSALSLFEAQNYREALELLNSIEGYSDSDVYTKICQDYIDGIRWNDEIDGQIYSSTYLDACRIVRAESYQGNQGDSFVDVIGTNPKSRGNRSIDGRTYSHGLEAWIARWNSSSEISWAYAIFDLGTQYQSLSGHVTLIDSYNTDNFDSTLYFYDGERLIESFRLSPQTIPFEFSVDVTGVTQLKVYVGDNVAVAGGTSFGIVDAVLSTIRAESSQTSGANGEIPEETTVQIDYFDNTPFQQKYWVIFTEGYRNGRIEASTIDSSLPADHLAIVWDSSLVLNNTSGSDGCNQYYLDENGEWVYIGNYRRLTDNATNVIASNLDVVDQNGNIIVSKTPYSMIDWDEVGRYR